MTATVLPEPRAWWSDAPEPVRAVLGLCATRGGDLHTDEWQRIVELFCPTMAPKLNEIADAIANAQRYECGEWHPDDDTAGDHGMRLEREHALMGAQLAASLIEKGAR